MNKVQPKRDDSAEISNIVRNLSLLDDDFMTHVFTDNIGLTEFVLRIILAKKDLKVCNVITQQERKGIIADGKGFAMDIVAMDSNDNYYDIEIQNDNTGANVKRARYYSAMLDSQVLKKKEDYKAMRSSYVIFITKNDVLKCGKPIYHIDRTIRETGQPFNDGNHIIYVNGMYINDKTALGKLMHDFKCTNPKEMYYNEMRTAVEHFTTTQEGTKMCDAIRNYGDRKMSEGIELGRERGRKEGRNEGIELGRQSGMCEGIELGRQSGREQAARNFIRLGVPLETVAKGTGLSIDYLRTL